MKESLRRVVLFTVIVITGSVMILVDVPLIIMIPIILAVGFVILLLLGAITVTDIRSVFTRVKLQNLKKTGVLKRLDDIKFFEKKPAQAPAQQDKKPVSPAKKEGKPISKKNKTGISLHLRSFFSSLGSLGTVLKQRSKHGKKVEHINELLDKTVSEKVKGSALAKAGNNVSSKTPLPAGIGGSSPQEHSKDQDPFLSLSGDEFDINLLDGLEDQDNPLPESSRSPEPSQAVSANDPGMAITEPDIPLPSLDISSVTDDILKDNAEGLEEFKDLEGGESIDQDFEDLDNLSLDDIDLDIDMEEEIPEESVTPSAATENPAPTPAASSDSSSTTTIKTDWVPSDAPKDLDMAGNETSTGSEMASFAGGASGSDADLLSSLASDVKKVTKEKNISLLRDLKDFKAPADDIENELKGVYETMKSVPNQKKKVLPPPKGVK
jgi:hypothetical protein